MVCFAFFLLMLGLFSLALTIPLLIAIIQGSMNDGGKPAPKARVPDSPIRPVSSPAPQPEAGAPETAKGTLTAPLPPLQESPPPSASVAEPEVVRPPAEPVASSPRKPEIPAGMRLDPELGLIYEKAPDPEAQDDLTKIKGVASVLEKRLHAFGVYTFWQIANWDDAVMAKFSERLSFKDRIRRDQWRSQCARLHEERSN